ncbi:hypothetical protein [Flavobacterium sp. FlaQc-48]
MLKDEGMNVSIDEAVEILKFLTDMATVVIRKFLSGKKESQSNKY